MPIPAHPGRMLFLNIPVGDLARSKAFFTELGFVFNPTFTDETAACMMIGEQAFAMLLTREKFAEFAKLPVGDPRRDTQALYCFGVASRDEVDSISAAALAQGATEADGAEDYGFIVLAQLPRPRRPRLAGHVDGPGRGRGRPRGVHGRPAGDGRAGLICERARLRS